MVVLLRCCGFHRSSLLLRVIIIPVVSILFTLSECLSVAVCQFARIPIHLILRVVHSEYVACLAYGLRA